ncbi:hypothetical protein BD626DRAFT_132890 [Schizophyllum amplum]|uniref:SHSP domain-containing protein n=1 Tax=Schizophyllum amplum TaxID=97359 RepID=A0A550C6P0_9AGAR|nr:hypothetical protein BD626DRAFT_132890 [Auriculariopsis ampla]
MSYNAPYPGQYAGSQSNPPTPHEGAPPIWDTSLQQQPQESPRLRQQHTQHHSQQQQQHSQQELAQQALSPHTHLSPNSIFQLDDSLSQAGLPNLSSFHLPPPPSLRPSHLPPVGPSHEPEPSRPGDHDPSRVHSSLSSNAPGGSGMLHRTAPTGRRVHPYQRPQSVAPMGARHSVPSSQHVRYGQLSMQSGAGPVPMQSRHPSPSSSSATSPIAGIAGHLAAAGFVQQQAQRSVPFVSSLLYCAVDRLPSVQATSPITLPSAQFPPLAQGGERGSVSHREVYSRVLSLRTETFYDDTLGEYSALLEVPGVRPSDLSVTLVKNAHSRAQEIIVQGQRQDPASEGKGQRICQGLVYGRFRKVLAVGSEVKSENVLARMANGILTITVRFGPPAPLPEPRAIMIL